jgi:hypothetical protein
MLHLVVKSPRVFLSNVPWPVCNSQFPRSECEAQVKKYPGAVFKSFQNYSDADSFVSAGGGRGAGGGQVASSNCASTSLVSSARERYAGNFAGGSTR